MNDNNKQLLEKSIVSTLSNSEIQDPVELAMTIGEVQGLEVSVAEVRSLLNFLVRQGKVFEHQGKYLYLEIAEMENLTSEFGSQLSEREEAEYEWLVSIPKTAFVGSGLALARIRNRRLYRRNYGTFEEFCQKELGYTRRIGNYCIIGAEIYCQIRNATQNKMGTICSQSKNDKNNTEVLGTICSQNFSLPTCESQIRPLSKFNPEKRVKYWCLAVERAKGVPTAKIVKQIIAEQENMERSNVYKPEDGRLRCGMVVRISSKNNPELKIFHNCWAQIVGVNENSYDVLAWNGAKTEISRNDFSLVPNADTEVARSLVERLNRIRLTLEDKKNEDVHLRAFLQYLGTQAVPELTPWSEAILQQTEEELGD
jgi:hypothetical protein